VNHITTLEIQLAEARAEADSLRQSFANLRAFVFDKGNRNERGGYVQVGDVTSFCEQAGSLANDAAEAAGYNERGPAIAAGGCAYVNRKTCSHEPSLRPNAWHCPLCAMLLPAEPGREWNDTDARAQERMRLHYRQNHYQGGN